MLIPILFLWNTSPYSAFKFVWRLSRASHPRLWLGLLIRLKEDGTHD